MLDQLNRKKWFFLNLPMGPMPQASTAHAVVFRCKDGFYRVFSERTCHAGIVVHTAEQADAAERWLRHQHAKNRKLCTC